MRVNFVPLFLKETPPTRFERAMDLSLSVRFVLPLIVLSSMGVMAIVTITLLVGNTQVAVNDVVIALQSKPSTLASHRVSTLSSNKTTQQRRSLRNIA